MYGAETWDLKKAQEHKSEVAEMRMLRWMCGVTKLNKIQRKWGKSQRNPGKKVEVVWVYEYVGRRAMEMKAQGRRK